MMPAVGMENTLEAIVFDADQTVVAQGIKRPGQGVFDYGHLNFA